MRTTLKNIVSITFFALLLLVSNANAMEKEIKTLESALKLENWMVNEKTWNKNNTNVNDYLNESESALKLENWMMNEQSWNVNTEIAHEMENKLQLENWMVNEGNWKTDKINIESKLTIEPWMMDGRLWR